MILFIELFANVKCFGFKTFIRALCVIKWNEKDEKVLKWSISVRSVRFQIRVIVVEGNFVFWFGAQFNSTHNFTQSGCPILSGQQKLSKLPNTPSLAEQRRPVQTSHWRFFNSSSSMDTWGNLSNLWIPCAYFLLDQGIPVEYELDTFNTPHTGITLCHPQNWRCRCDV